MFSYKDRFKAVKLLIKYGTSYFDIIRKLIEELNISRTTVKEYIDNYLKNSPINC